MIVSRSSRTRITSPRNYLARNHPYANNLMAGRRHERRAGRELLDIFYLDYHNIARESSSNSASRAFFGVF